MKKFKVRVKGTTPLLHNKPEQYGFDNKLKVINPNVNGSEEAIKKLYSSDGIICHPATHLEASLREAGKDLRVKGKGKATYSKTFGSMVSIEPVYIPLIHDSYEIFASLTVNPNTKGRNVTYRPKFNNWELEFETTIDDEIPPEVLKEGLERAGKYQGIGDWRPNKKGKFGKFMVTKFEEL